MRRPIFVIAAIATLVACNQAVGDNTAKTTANAEAPAKKRPTYCFFKDAATKGWAASVGAGGNVAVKGKVHLDDRRYSGALTESEVIDDRATVWVTMAPNTTGVGAEGNWWNVGLTIPNSEAVKNVSVLCGRKAVAELTVRR